MASSCRHCLRRRHKAMIHSVTGISRAVVSEAAPFGLLGLLDLRSWTTCCHACCSLSLSWAAALTVRQNLLQSHLESCKDARCSLNGRLNLSAKVRACARPNHQGRTCNAATNRFAPHACRRDKGQKGHVCLLGSESLHKAKSISVPPVLAFKKDRARLPDLPQVFRAVSCSASSKCCMVDWSECSGRPSLEAGRPLPTRDPEVTHSTLKSPAIRSLFLTGSLRMSPCKVARNVARR